jgi:hypothetical protein
LAVALCAAGCSGSAPDADVAFLSAAGDVTPLAPSRGRIGLLPADADGSQLGGASTPFGLTVGIRPLVVIERSDMPEPLELDGPFGYEVGLHVSEDAQGKLSLIYLPLEGEKSGDPVDAWIIDWGGGFAHKLWEGPVYGQVRYEVGTTFLWLNYEKSTYDTIGTGLFTSGIFGIHAADFPLALEASVNAHGWLGFDAHDPQSAWAFTVGVNLIVKF